MSLLNKENRKDPKLLKGSVYAVDFNVFLLKSALSTHLWRFGVEPSVIIIKRDFENGV